MSIDPEPPQVLERTLVVQAPDSAVAVLSQATGLSRSVLKDAMTKGAVWWRANANPAEVAAPGGESNLRRQVRLRRAKRQLAPGDEISIYYNARILSAAPPPPVLVDDQQHYSVWYKPAGLMSSGTRFGDHHSIARQVEQRLQRPAFGVHRLDRFTRGLMLIAHGRGMAEKLSRLFRQRDTLKCYQAQVVGTLRQPQVITEPVDDKPACTRIFPVSGHGDGSLVSIVIETGRKHQIRKHLAGIGLPVVGDRLHGGAQTPGLQLVASGLGFTCPIRQCWVDYVLPRRFCLFEPQPVSELGSDLGRA